MARNSLHPAGRASAAMLEELYLAQPFLCLLQRLVRPTEVLSFAGKDLVAVFRFLDHNRLSDLLAVKATRILLTNQGVQNQIDFELPGSWQ